MRIVADTARRAGSVARALRRGRDAAAPLEPDLVVWESYFGKGMLCHPEAIFAAVRRAPDLGHLRHVWVLDDPAAHPHLLEAFRGDPRVAFVRRGSAAYARALSTAGTLVNNSTFPAWWAKRDGQTYLNTWHGTPLKSMGYDEPGGARTAANTVRNFLSADLLLTSADYMTRTMYEGAYRLTNLAPAAIVDVGSPRTDGQHLDAAGRSALLRRMRAAGVDVADDERVVLIAPTWRGTSFTDPTDDLDRLLADVRRVRERLPAGVRLLLRVHQQVAQAMAARPDAADLVVPHTFTTNEVLGVTDLLVTDYSSIFFDFLGLDRPVVFFTPDHEDYARERGTYLGPADLPGPVTSTTEDLARVLAAAWSGSPEDPVRSHEAARADARLRFAPRDDGHSSERVVDVLFRGARPEGGVRPVRADGRPRLLLYLGGMKSNGITTAALSLLENLDVGAVDTTVLLGVPQDEDQAANAALVPARHRQLFRIAPTPPALGRYVAQLVSVRFGGQVPARVRRRAEAALGEEWRRIAGGARFDVVVDFSGYSGFWTMLLARVPCRSRAVWLHNDLAADQRKRVGRSRPHGRTLATVFSTYGEYDHLVSVSPALREINARMLSAFAPAEKFTSARNTIDARRVVRGAADVERVVPAPPPGTRQVVTVGRLAPEKNHARLVRAFAQVHAEDPATRLVIVGAGPLTGRVQGLVDELGLTDAVTITGLVRNPWRIMADSHVFTLSSDFEGQPMVVLEARILGLPIVSTAFGSVRDSLEEGVGLVVERTDTALADGLRRALAGEVPAPAFDVDAYNALVVGEFARAVGLG